jgi:hypothetical protein
MGGSKFVRRRNLHEETISLGGLLDQGSLSFNLCNIKIEGRTIKILNSNPSMSDAYDKKRYNNVTDFSANVTTGIGQTTDISNQSSGIIIPAGASCVFKATLKEHGTVAAGYQYIAVLLRNTSTGSIKRIGAFGQNAPASSASWTQSADAEIGCIAIEYSHFRGNANPAAVVNTGTFELSLTVNGEEWL